MTTDGEIHDGDVEINIGSDGLEPALEAFMREIIDKVRAYLARIADVRGDGQ